MKNAKNIGILLSVAILISITAVKIFVINRHNNNPEQKQTTEITLPTTTKTEAVTEIKITPPTPTPATKPNTNITNVTIPPISTATKTENKIIIVTTTAPEKITTSPCSQPIFTNNITDLTAVNNIVIPPNFVGTELKTHSYVETDHASVPIYAPTNMTMFSGAYYETGPYTLNFQAACGVTVRFAHITEPIEKITSALPNTPAPANDSRDYPLKKPIAFKAGDLIGYTTGTSLAGNWDFGVYDSNTKNKYAGSENFNWSTIYTTAVCPYDYFSPELKSAYVAKYNLRANGGAKPDGESFCK